MVITIEVDDVKVSNDMEVCHQRRAVLDIIFGSSVPDRFPPFHAYIDPVVGRLHLEYEGVPSTLLSKMNTDTTA